MTVPRIAFAAEMTLGNRTYFKNLQAGLSGRTDVAPVWLPIEEHADDLWQRLPFVNRKLSLMGGLRARAALLRARADGGLQGAFIHTQRIAHLCRGFMSRTPTVVSMDATPYGLETYLRVYGLPPQHRGVVGKLKHAINRRTYLAARHVVSMSDFTKRSLVEDYGIPESRVSVIPPSVDTAQWRPAAPADKPRDGVVRLLFVGGDWKRKGGDLLLRWARETKATGWELHLVTSARLEVSGPVVVHSGLTPNLPQLVSLFRRSDLFVLPTAADLSPNAVIEAKACGLPVILTRTGGVSELVREGVDGHGVEPGDYAALRDRIEHLLAHPDDRDRMGREARKAAVERHDVVKNSSRIVDAILTS